MIVPCECSAKLRIDDAKIAERDVRVRCPRCGNILTVPRKAEAPVLPVQPLAGPAASHDHSAPLVLVAHDSDVVREMVGGVLLDAGFRVEHAADGVEAMAKATSRRPDVMVVDVGIPGIYGFELCERLKGADGTRGIKIILLASVYGITRYKRNPTSLYGADDFIEKHHIADGLIEKIRRLLGAHGKESPVLAAVPGLADETPPRGVPQREVPPAAAPGSASPSAGKSEQGHEITFFSPKSLMGDPEEGVREGERSSRQNGAADANPPEAQEISPESFSLDASIFEREECNIPMVEEKDPEAVEKARRFARIIVSDIALYNQDAVREGVRKGTFYELLRDDIEEGRQLYEARVPASVRAKTDYYRETIENFISRQKHIER